MPRQSANDSDSVKLQELFARLYSETGEIAPLKGHASQRRIYRLRGKEHTAIGVVNDDLAENRAFIGFAAHFKKRGLPVPEILAVDQGCHAYLQQDLGDQTLLDALNSSGGALPELPAAVRALYEQALSYLPRFQIEASSGIDYGLCHQSASFDYNAVIHDLDSFERNFLKQVAVEYSVTALSKEFEALARYLAAIPCSFFMYRDFQARNIMVLNGSTYFIDFQSGRRGPLQYDVVSLLYQSTAGLADSDRSSLLKHYLGEAAKYVALDRDEFMRSYPAFVLVRILQALGAYGKAGLIQGKEYFVQSIPLALNNLLTALDSGTAPVALPTLRELTFRLAQASNR